MALRFRLIHILARISLIAFMVLWVSSALANPRLLSHDIYANSALDYLDRAASLGVQVSKDKNEVVVMARFSPGRLKLYAQTRNRLRAYEVAAAIDKALSTIPNLSIDYSTSGVYGMVRVRRDNSRLFVHHLDQTLPVSKVFLELAKGGWKPRIVVEMRNIEPMRAQPEADRVEGKYRYWIAQGQDEAQDISAHESVPTTTYLPFFCVPLSIAFVFWGLMPLTKPNPNQAFLRQMRPFMAKLSIGLALMIVSVYSVYRTTPEDNLVLVDAWVNPEGFAMIAVVIVSLVVVGVTFRLLYGLRPSLDLPFHGDVAHKGRKAELERIQKRSLLQAGLVVFVVGFVCIALALLIAPPGSPREVRIAVSWTMRVLIILGILAGWGFRNYLLRRYSPKVSDDENLQIQDLASAAADQLGVPAPIAAISSCGEDNLVIEAYYDSKSRLIATRGAVLDLTESELKALILQEISTKSMETTELRKKMKQQNATKVLLIAAASIAAILLKESFLFVAVTVGIGFYLPLDSRRSNLRFTFDSEAFEKSLEIEPNPKVWTSLMEKQALASCQILSVAAKIPAKLFVSRAEVLKPLLTQRNGI